jgi:arsenical pump membrane protein
MLIPVVLTILSFLATVVLIFWRPRGLNEAIPAICGAVVVFLCGGVSLSDVGVVAATVSGAAVTIMATIVMAIVLESFGFFYWVAEKMAIQSKGSGTRLFWYINLLCFLMTLFFNNDGSILITTPVLVILLTKLGFNSRQMFPYLLSGAMIATASSAPIGVSNIVNLVALKIVGMTLYMHTAMMFVPATLGLIVLSLLQFAVFYRKLPKRIPMSLYDHPLKQPGSGPDKHHPPHIRHKLPPRFTLPPSITIPEEKKSKFMRNIFLYVFGVRVSLFVVSFFGVPVWIAAVLGSVILLAWRWMYFKISPKDMLKKTPWHVLVFAFGMYLIVYGMNNIGLTAMIIHYLKPLVTSSLLHASLIMGLLVSVMSDIFNNHPALMIGTLTLTHMGLDPLTLKISYLASVIGSDMGSLLIPIGLLATLFWMFILKQANIKIRWKEYLKVSFLVVPPAVLFTLVVLYYWVSLIFGGVGPI